MVMTDGRRSFYVAWKNADSGTLNAILNVMARCRFCSHSRAAHTDGVRCALCPCISRPRELVQQSFTFRSKTVRGSTVGLDRHEDCVADGYESDDSDQAAEVHHRL